MEIKLCQGLHVTVTVLAYFLFWLLFRYQTLEVKHINGYWYNYYVVLAFVACYHSFGQTYNAYLLGFSRIRTLASAQFISQLFSTVFLYVIVSMAWNKLTSPLWLMAFLGICAVLDCIWSYWANGLYYRLHPTKDAIMLYTSNISLSRVENTSGKPIDRLYRIKKQVCCEGKTYPEVIKEVSRMVSI